MPSGGYRLAFLVAICFGGILAPLALFQKGPPQGVATPRVEAGQLTCDPPDISKPPPLNWQERERLLGKLSSNTRRHVARQSWVKELDLDSLELLRVIGVIECHVKYDAKHLPERQGMNLDVSSILSVAEKERWGRDGYSPEEKRLLIAYYTAFFRPRGPDPGAKLSRSLERRQYRLFALSVSGQVFFAGTGENPNRVDVAIEIVERYIESMDRMFGPLRFRSFVVSLEQTRLHGACGETYVGPQAVVIDPECLNPVVVTHELTHLYLDDLRRVYPYWYQEGAAYFWSAFLTDSLQGFETFARRDLAELAPMTRILLESKEALSDGSQDDASILFMIELHRLLGTDGMITLARRVKGGASGAGILKEIRALTPSGMTQAVDDLIREWFSIP